MLASIRSSVAAAQAVRTCRVVGVAVARRAFSTDMSEFTQAVEVKMPEFYIVDSTLREGEQFATCEFTKQERIFIAKTLDKLGVDYIEVVNPAASLQAVKDCEAIARLNLNAKVLTHTRCHMHDVKTAVETGVDGVNVYMATSKILREHSHGKGIDAVIESAKEVISYVKKHGLEVRFSCEDSFRSDRTDLLKIYSAVAKLGVDRVGIADTVGVATPSQVADTVRAVRAAIGPQIGIEFHTHNDTGCCIANALVALEAGATHIDTAVLGIGERNGITPLGGFLARMYTIDKDFIKNRYDLSLLQMLDKYVAAAVGVPIPFNNYITGSAAYTHKAGVHSKAVMTNPNAYEVIAPEDFGVERKIQLAHRLTGWNAMSNRAKQLGLDLTDDLVKAATTRIKNLADQRSVTIDQVDAILMKMAASPRASSSSFITWTKGAGNDKLRSAAKAAADALAKYEAELASEAIASLDLDKKDMRPQMLIKVEGHLFDSALLNRMIDMAVDSPCDFEVEDLHVAPRNELMSNTRLRFWGDDQAALDGLLTNIKKLIEGNEPIAQCKLSLLDPNNPEAADPAAEGQI
eukprot:comp22021_c0_seq1/m.31923 comp22021_c0_seq1/g.31923  ORF comp22021_c0_seq1/g.31923 comp22021_c0_seq1/m.31923 type:complete len:576 (-) comp22021_c0_seq1:593-2320(-)